MAHTKDKKFTADTESQLQRLNIRHRGFERYENADVLIEGQPENLNYRWRITFRHTGRTAGAVSLADALAQIRRAIDPNVNAHQPPAPKFGTAAATHRHPKQAVSDKQYGLGISESDL